MKRKNKLTVEDSEKDRKLKKICTKILILLRVKSRTELILKPIVTMRKAQINPRKVKNKTLKSQNLVLQSKSIFSWLKWTMNNTFLEKLTKMIQFLNVFQMPLQKNILDQPRHYLQKKVKNLTYRTLGWMTCLHMVRL